MQTIGVFDSGFGGLTVLRALLPLVPGAHFVYLGDTARLPYGEKSQQTIARYALSSAAFLLAQGAEMLVVACNTASALALDELRASLPIPVIGVIEPGTQAARLATSSNLQNPQILVLATSATVRSGAYTRACQAAGLTVFEKACPPPGAPGRGGLDRSPRHCRGRPHLSQRGACAGSQSDHSSPGMHSLPSPEAPD